MILLRTRHQPKQDLVALQFGTGPGTERLIPAGELRGAVFDCTLCGLQPRGAVAVPVALAGFDTVFIIFASRNIPSFGLKGLLDDQSRGKLDQLAAPLRRGQSSFDQVGKVMACLHGTG